MFNSSRSSFDDHLYGPTSRRLIVGNLMGQSLCASAGFPSWKFWTMVFKEKPVQRLVLTPSCLGRCLVPRMGFPQYGYQRKTEGSKGSFNDLIPPDRVWGKLFFILEKLMSVYGRQPSFDLSDSLFCTITPWKKITWNLQITHLEI